MHMRQSTGLNNADITGRTPVSGPGFRGVGMVSYTLRLVNWLLASRSEKVSHPIPLLSVVISMPVERQRHGGPSLQMIKGQNIVRLHDSHEYENKPLPLLAHLYLSIARRETQPVSRYLAIQPRHRPRVVFSDNLTKSLCFGKLPTHIASSHCG